MHNKPSVAVVILSWNGRKFLEQFLPSLLETTYSNATFYVADNASTDDTVDYVTNNFPSIKLIKIKKNFGFAKGYNLALKEVQSDYYVLLNQDVEVTPGWIEPVIDLMEEDGKIAACQPKIRAYNNKEWFEYAGAAGGFIDRHGYAFCRGRFFNITEKDEGQYNKASDIVWASGACLFIRSKLFHDSGGFDSDFFAHFEEIDLCWRLKNAGYSIKYGPDSIVYHIGGGSLPQGNPKKTFLNYRNNMSTLIKNLPQSSLLLCITLRFFLDMISAYKSLLFGRQHDFFAIFKAHLYFITHIGKLLSKRKAAWLAVQRMKISQPNRKGFYKGSIITEHFIKSVNNFSELEAVKFE